MINLSSRQAVESAVFIKWAIPDFETAYISDYNVDITFGGNTYTNLGRLLSISDITNELRATASELSISLSGIPTGSVSAVLNQQIKGSTVEIYRGFFDPVTHALLNLAPSTNPLLKFKGIVTNYEISDDVDVTTSTATTTITLTCNSIVEVLSNKVSGRRTNPADFPNEQSMSRVLALSKSNFNFGAPR